MTLSFPNLSRSYDAARHRVRFWGHDDSIEIPFFIEESAIFKLFPATRNAEDGILAAFDAGRARVTEAAQRVYRPHQRRSFYVLAAGDF
jgi:hypothetical protein